MANVHEYEAVLFLAPGDVDLIGFNIAAFKKNTKAKKIVIVSHASVRQKIPLEQDVEFLDENTILDGLTLDGIRNILEKRTDMKTSRNVIGGNAARGNWYFQQFAKMAYAYRSRTDFYLAWDADTLLLNPLRFWKKNNERECCLFTLKEEYVYSYFDTLNILFGKKVGKKIRDSFIAEHMMIRKIFMLELIKEIEDNETIEGKTFYEKIINAVADKYLYRGFSEYETYGNYVETFHPGSYDFRRLRTLRNGGEIFDARSVNTRTLKWLSKNYDTISFEKWNRVSFFGCLLRMFVPVLIALRIPGSLIFFMYRVYTKLYFMVFLFIKGKITHNKQSEYINTNSAQVYIYIGFQNPFVHKRGVENVILFQSRFLPDNIKKYYLFTDDFGTELTRTWEGINCYGVRRGINQFYAANNIIKRIKKMGNNPRIIIHSHNIIMSAFFGYKTDILTVHDSLYYQRKHARHPFWPLYWFIEKIAYYRSAKIHFVSSFSRSRSLFPKKRRAYIIPNTSPLEKLLIKNHQAGKGRYNDFYVIFSVRGIQERTRIDLLLSLARNFRENNILLQGKRPIILVAGKGNMLSSYRRRIASEQLTDYINLLGYVSDSVIADFYTCCDMVIVSAEYCEGFGLPVIEAYCAGKQVLASNVCAIPELIIDKKYLFKNKPEELYQKTLALANGDMLTLDSNHIRDYYKKYFSNETIERCYKILYDISNT